MEQFIQKLTRLLGQHFADADVELESLGSGRFSGFLIWDGFEGQEQIKRQRQVWKVLRSELTATEQLKVAAILTLTRQEMAAAREG
jgi:acid stress-induced BolA-like protein IbaG/YrbA